MKSDLLCSLESCFTTTKRTIPEFPKSMICFSHRVIQALLLAESWARKNNLKFPPIDAEEQYRKYGIKEYYVLAHPTDSTCPVVMHFVLVNKTFREQSRPGLFEDLREIQLWFLFGGHHQQQQQQPAALFAWP